MIKEEFLKDVASWNNHLPLLWLALELTKNSLLPVTEFGSGNGSTIYLRQYCKDSNREFYSYDNNREWAEQMGSNLITNWSNARIYNPCSICLVDCAPGEIRHEIMAIMKDRADIIVAHDTEENGSGNYLYSKIWPLFKYRINLSEKNGGAGASAVSNKIDLTIFDKEVIAGYKLWI